MRVMNYEKIYFNLIDKARNRKLEGYREKHHIIPRCAGGTDEPHNLIELTPEEHFVAHQLLLKMFIGTQLEFKFAKACVAMTFSSNGQRVNNKLFGWLRRKNSELQKGVPKTPEMRKKLSEANKGKKPSPESIAKGVATRKAMGLKPPSWKGRKRTEHNRENLRKAKALIIKDWDCHVSPVELLGVQYKSLKAAREATGISNYMMKKHPSFKYL